MKITNKILNINFETKKDFTNFIKRITKITFSLTYATLFNTLRAKTISKILDNISDALIVIDAEIQFPLYSEGD